MEASPVRVIAYCSLLLGLFFLAKSISIKTPKYVLHELLAFKVNKSRFFRRYIGQKMEAIIGFVFSFLAVAILVFLEIEALGGGTESALETRIDWWQVMGGTVVALVLIAWILNRITRFFSGKIFVEHVRFMVEEHGYSLESDQGLVLELGRIMRIARDDEDTLESYCTKVRTKMKVGAENGGKGPLSFR